MIHATTIKWNSGGIWGRRKDTKLKLSHGIVSDLAWTYIGLMHLSNFSMWMSAIPSRGLETLSPRQSGERIRELYEVPTVYVLIFPFPVRSLLLSVLAHSWHDNHKGWTPWIVTCRAPRRKYLTWQIPKYRYLEYLFLKRLNKQILYLELRL